MAVDSETYIEGKSAYFSTLNSVIAILPGGHEDYILNAHFDSALFAIGDWISEFKEKLMSGEIEEIVMDMGREWLLRHPSSHATRNIAQYGLGCCTRDHILMAIEMNTEESQ